MVKSTGFTPRLHFCRLHLRCLLTEMIYIFRYFAAVTFYWLNFEANIVQNRMNVIPTGLDDSFLLTIGRKYSGNRLYDQIRPIGSG
jgi:hypothetical protein